MKIAIVGYGRMGHLIEEIALSRGHEIVCRIDADNTDEFNSEAFRKADAAIEFSTPSTAVSNILACFAAKVPVVVGTTGWNDALPDIKDMAEKGAGTIMFGSNYSIGVNIFMAVNRYLASIMNKFDQYKPSMLEIHHIHKLDHPSGTAVTLAEEIVEKVNRVSAWGEPEGGKTLADDVLAVDHERRGEVPGTHIITWDSDVDTITISHEAKNRRGFALGAVMAAEWIVGKKGFFTVGDMFAF